jgi:hypothetical protein
VASKAPVKKLVKTTTISTQTEFEVEVISKDDPAIQEKAGKEISELKASYDNL